MIKFFIGLAVGFILGILASVAVGIVLCFVVPATTHTSTDAREHATRSALQTVRSQIELFKIQHDDTPPAEAGLWKILLEKSGANDIEIPSPTGSYGPYLQVPPVNPLNGQSRVGRRPAPDIGWVYRVEGRNYTLEAVNDRGDGVAPY